MNSDLLHHNSEHPEFYHAIEEVLIKTVDQKILNEAKKSKFVISESQVESLYVILKLKKNEYSY